MSDRIVLWHNARIATCDRDATLVEDGALVIRGDLASEAELFEQAAPRLQCLLDEGVATVEIKSGYGLTLEQERKMLRVARQLAARFPVTIKTTFLAAHALPPEYAGRADDYIAAVTTEWLPVLHGEGLIDLVDVYCERIAFNVAQSERVLAAAAKLGIPVRMHAEQPMLGITRNAARACGEGGSRGTLVPGALADFALWNVQALDELTYWIGRDACAGVVRGGAVVMSALERIPADRRCHR